MAKSMLISIIIPVYKVEKYLEQCINSVLNQTYTNIELLLIDDGSPDSSPMICDKFAAHDSRVKVVHKANGGLSDARNVGLGMANGDYVVFMDSDDFWSNIYVLENLVIETLQTPECDFIGFNCSYYYEDKRKTIPWVRYDDEICNTTASTVCIEKLVASGTFPISACMKMIKRECLQGKIEFIKGIYSEDIPWFIELLKKSDKCRFVNQYVYMYRKGVVSSISGSFSYKKYQDLFQILKDGVEVNKKERNERVQHALFSFWAYELCILRAMTGFMERNKRHAELKELYKYDWLFGYQLHPKVRKVALVQKLGGRAITNFMLYRYLRMRLA